MKNIITSFGLFTLFLLSFTSCDDDNPVPEYQIPTIYSFENVDYSGQQQRLAMLLEIKNYLVTANSTGVVLDADRLKAMYENEAEAAWSGNYDASKQLKSKTFDGQQEVFAQLFDAVAVASESNNNGSNGQAGVVTSKGGDKKYLLTANGVELTQIIEKGLMGACFYYQANSVYLSDERMNVDNEDVESGKGTEMEHHWDEAFGYLGVPIDFPSNTDGLNFWGSYCHNRNALLSTNTSLMDAFLRGRAAISNDDLSTRDEAINTIRATWEQVSAGTAIHYLNTAIENFDDFALRAHALSEAVAFTYSLQFNEVKRLTNSEVNDIMMDIGGSIDFLSMNFYETDTTEIENARNVLAAAFNWEDIKNDF